jgi:hypothetical protein
MIGSFTSVLSERAIWVASLLCLVVNSTCSQISSENVEKHFITNARAAALADAIAADAADVTCMYWNPASLSFLQERSVVLNYSLERIRGRDNVMNENVVFSLIDERGFEVGLGATHSHVGYIEAGSPLSGYDFNQGSFDLGLALALSRFSSIGIVSTIRHGRAGSQSTTVGSAVMGLMYYPSPELSYGLVYQGLGNGIEYSFDPSGFQTNPIKMRLLNSLQMGVTARFNGFNTLEVRPTVVISVATQKIWGTEGIIYKGGVEVWPISFLALRIGYWSGTQTVAAKYGAGVRLGQWQLDYGVSPTELEPVFHQVSLAFSFSSRYYDY